jgi:hypothetical protein
MNTTMYEKLVKLPMAQLAAVAQQLGAPKVGDKDTVARSCCLYRDFDVQVAINFVLQNLPTIPAPAPAPAAVQSIEDAIVASPHVQSIASHNSRVLKSVADLRDQVTQMSRDMSQASGDTALRLNAVKASVAKAEPLPDIGKMVAEAFAPFRSVLTTKPAAVAKLAKLLPGVDVLASERFPVSAGMVRVFGEAQPADPDYVWPVEALQFACLASLEARPMWLYGDRATGKSEFVKQFALRTGRPFVRINFDRNLERMEFLGAMQMVNGNTVWVDGSLLKALRTQGCVILLDEVTLGRTENMAVLHSILESHGEFVIADTGERVSRAPGVMIFVADNTNGCGDESGRFIGTQPVNAAFVDRFWATIKLDYLSEQDEIKVLMSRTGAGNDDATKVVKLLNKCRAQVGSDIIDAPSMRPAMAMCEMLTAGVGFEAAWTVTVVNKSPLLAQEHLRQMLNVNTEF